MSVNLLCKLTTRSPDLTGGFGGLVELTPVDVAAGLSKLGLNTFQTGYIRALILNPPGYSQEDTRLSAEPWHEESQLARDAWDWAMDIALSRGWDIPKGEYMIRKLSFIAVDLRINSLQLRCRRCKGPGYYRKRGESVLVKCDKCAGLRVDKATQMEIGNGKRRLSNRWFASRLGIDHKTYAAKWQDRFWYLTKQLWEIERCAGYISGVIDEPDYLPV